MTLDDVWPVVAVGATALIGYGEIRARVSSLRNDVNEKASKELVNQQYTEIIHRLERIEQSLNGRHD